MRHVGGVISILVIAFVVVTLGCIYCLGLVIRKDEERFKNKEKKDGK